MPPQGPPKKTARCRNGFNLQGFDLSPVRQSVSPLVPSVARAPPPQSRPVPFQAPCLVSAFCLRPFIVVTHARLLHPLFLPSPSPTERPLICPAFRLRAPPLPPRDDTLSTHRLAVGAPPWLWPVALSIPPREPQSQCRPGPSITNLPHPRRMTNSFTTSRPRAPVAFFCAIASP
jgi:hypothetical protein